MTIIGAAIGVLSGLMIAHVFLTCKIVSVLMDLKSLSEVKFSTIDWQLDQINHPTQQEGQ